MGVSDGPIMAASDFFNIRVQGKGGHGAAPGDTVDAVVEAAAVVTALQQVVSRNINPLDAGCITCGTIRGGYGYNIIADDVEITGTVRRCDFFFFFSSFSLFFTSSRLLSAVTLYIKFTSASTSTTDSLTPPLAIT